MKSPKFPNPLAPQRRSPSIFGVLTALLSLLGLCNAQADVFLMGSQLGISPVAGWQVYTGKDAPPPGYLGFLNPGTNTLSTTVPLGQTLQPGNYILSLRVLNYDANGTFSFTLGGASGSGSFNDRDYNYIWTTAVPVTIQSPTSTLAVTFNRTLASNIAQKYLFTGLFISSNTNYVVLKSDKLVELVYPTPAQYDDSPAIPGNLFPNGSFEGGIGTGWGLEGLPRKFALQSIWSTDPSFHGNSCIRLDLPGREIYSLIRGPIRVRPNRIHTISLYVKALQPMAVTLFLTNTFSPPAGFPAGQAIEKRFVISNSWTRLSLSDRLLKYPDSEFNVQFTFESIVNNTVWIDAAQLEEGELRPFAPQHPMEVSIRQARIGGIYFEDEAVEVPIVVANQSTLARTSELNVQIYDYQNRSVLRTNFPVTVPANAFIQYDAALPTGVKGSFRVTAALKVPTATQSEAAISVIPRPPPPEAAANSRIGIHANFVPWQIDMLRSLGIQWIRGMSPGAYFRFAIAQPTEAKFEWYDNEVSIPLAHDMHIMGTLSQYPPKWAERAYLTLSNVVGSGFIVNEAVSNGNGSSATVTVALRDTDPTGHALQLQYILGTIANGDTLRGTQSGTTAKVSSSVYPRSVGLDKWSTFVRATVDHYKDMVDAWEIGNEPDKDPAGVPMPGGNPGFYTELLVRAIREITEVAPNAKIIAMGGSFTTNWFDLVAKKLTPAQLAAVQAFSTHLYPGNEDLTPGHVTLAKTRYGKQSWNTETAVWDLGFYAGPGANFRYEGLPVQPFRESERFYKGHWSEAANILRNLWVCLGAGMDRYFYYDARQIATPAFFDTTPSLIDYDDAIKVKGVAYSIAANLLRDANGQGRVTYTDARVRAYTFTRPDGSSFVALFSSDPLIQFSFPLPSALLSSSPRVLDMMGNPIPGPNSTAILDGRPIYILSSLSETALRTALAGVTAQVSADTTPPNVSITQSPAKVPAPNSSVEFRWLGIDNIDIPNINRPDAILYSYRVIGQSSTWSAWMPNTSVVLSNLPKGPYELQVKAKDTAGNESAVASEPFWVAEPPAVVSGVQAGS